MATRTELQHLARLRLREAEALFHAGLFDGCAYHCGYSVELALKARICATLNLEEYPEGRLKGAFRAHDFDDLLLLAGLESELPTSSLLLQANWQIASEWTPEWRYQAEGTYDRLGAQRMLDAVRARPDGVLEWISSIW